LASCKSPYIDIKISSNGECQYFTFVHIFIIDGHQVLVRKTTLENNDGIEKPAIAYEMQFEHITMIGNFFFENNETRDMAFRGFSESDAKNIAEKCMRRTAGLLK